MLLSAVNPQRPPSSWARGVQGGGRRQGQFGKEQVGPGRTHLIQDVSHFGDLSLGVSAGLFLIPESMRVKRKLVNRGGTVGDAQNSWALILKGDVGSLAHYRRC